MSETAYAFEGLPLEPVDAGTTVLVVGPTHGGTRDLALRMLAGGPGEGAIVVSTNQRSSRIAADCERVGLRLTADHTAILDCVGENDGDVPARVLPVSGPSDLTGIGMRFSDVYREFQRAEVERVRTGLYSASTLLTFSDLRTVSRFVHQLVGQIDRVGVLLVDPTSSDERAVGTLSQFCSGRIDVRDRDEQPELRARGLPGQPRAWTPFDPPRSDRVSDSRTDRNAVCVARDDDRRTDIDAFPGVSRCTSCRRRRRATSR